MTLYMGTFTLAGIVEALCLSYCHQIYIFFFLVQHSQARVWDRDGVLFAQLVVLECLVTAKCYERTNKNITLNKK